MSVQTKKRFKNLSKIVGIGLFALLMLTNIKLALLDDNELASGDISILGIEVNLFEATYACSLPHCIDVSCFSSPAQECTYIITDFGGMWCYYQEWW